MIFIKKKMIHLYSGEFRDVVWLLFSGQWRNAAYVHTFEDKFSRYIGTQAAVAVSSGRFALHCVLSAMGIGKGDEVILAAYNFKAVPETIIKVGACPVFVDIADDSLNINVCRIEEKITARTKAVIVGHMFGYPADIDEIQGLCQKHHIKLIEDCAHACGAEYKGRKVGSFGDAAFFSFGMSKNMSTFGGGMITTNDKAVMKSVRKAAAGAGFMPWGSLTRECLKTFVFAFLLSDWVYPWCTYVAMRLLRVFHWDFLKVLRARSTEPADNWVQFTGLQAYVGIKMLDVLDECNDLKGRAVRLLHEGLDQALFVQKDRPDRKPVFLYVTLLSADACAAANRLFLKGIDSDNGYMQNCEALFTDSRQCKVTEHICRSILLLQPATKLSMRESAVCIRYIHHNVDRVCA